jgi:hypothetical protein
LTRPVVAADYRQAMQASVSPRSVRLLAVFAALACCVAQLSAIVHLALVRHAACPEHGEWVHVDGPPRVHTAHETERATDGPALDALDEAHGHDHCLIALSGRERTTLAATSLLPRPPSLRFLAAPRGPPATLLHASLAPLHFAPKNSPPA